ncbi:MAG: BolA/IbaG family iron-sulfur metabolism protein [Legionellaceae bacterium]|nr:BolA/IbaG family iron-sulfur metabolism protein [Legionellaceae bacterium]
MTVSNHEIEQCLINIAGVKHVEVSGDGYHYQLMVVSNDFDGMTRLARQQWVYAKLQAYITSGELHALTMKTWTEAEWEKNRG